MLGLSVPCDALTPLIRERRMGIHRPVTGPRATSKAWLQKFLVWLKKKISTKERKETVCSWSLEWGEITDRVVKVRRRHLHK